LGFCLVPPDRAPNGLLAELPEPQQVHQRIGPPRRGQPVGGREIAQVPVDSQVLVHHRVLLAAADHPGKPDLTVIDAAVPAAPVIGAASAGSPADWWPRCWQDWDLVFCTPIGAPINSHDDWEDWHALLAGASVRTARVHDARHTAATLLLEQGIDIRVVQQILGHSQLSQTQRYTHVTAELSRHAADRMSEALWG
jgi:integrase